MRARPKISPKQPRVKGSCHQTARESDIIEPMASREITLETKAAGAHTRELIHRARRLAEKLGLHFVEATPEGEPMTEVAKHVRWYRK